MISQIDNSSPGAVTGGKLSPSQDKHYSGVPTITKMHYIPESAFICQKALRKHMQGGVCMPCGLLFYVFLDNKDVYMWQEKVYDPKA